MLKFCNLLTIKINLNIFYIKNFIKNYIKGSKSFIRDFFLCAVIDLAIKIIDNIMFKFKDYNFQISYYELKENH